MAKKKKPDYFQTFCKVSKAFGSTLSTDKLLDLVVESAIDTMDAKAACLFLSDEEKDLFVPKAQKGLSDNYLHAKPMHARQIVSAILKGGHLHIKDATTDPRVEHHDMKKAEGIASILDVPVMVRDKAIGILALYTSQPRDFNSDEIAFLTALAEQGGRAIVHARLLERIRRNSMLFLDLASSINSSLDIQKILHILTAETCDALGMKGASIRLINEDSGTLDLVTTHGLSEAFLDKGPVYAEKSIADALKGETVVIDDVASDERVQYREETVQEGIASMLSVPIKSRDKVVGVMRLFSAVKRRFPDDVLTLVEALAHTGALAIQNASMVLQLQQDKDDLEKDIWAHRSWF
jgi:GAF domain-containing protein